jgi:hypothetical protein
VRLYIGWLERKGESRHSGRGCGGLKGEYFGETHNDVACEVEQLFEVAHSNNSLANSKRKISVMRLMFHEGFQGVKVPQWVRNLELAILHYNNLISSLTLDWEKCID